MKKYAKITNEETKQCNVGLGTNAEFYKSIGMVEMEVEQAYNGSWYIQGYAPEKPAPTDEEQKQKRQQAFTEEADPLKYDYEEACARYGDDSEEAQNAKVNWLAKKDEIRERYPYSVNESI